MAGWLSSRLKAAEQLLQQIDQQAAVVAKKEGLDEQISEKRSHSTSRKEEAFGEPSSSEHTTSTKGEGRLFDRPFQQHQSRSGGKRNGGDQTGGGGSSSRKPSRASSSVVKPAKKGREDWSELLGSADLQVTSSAPRSSNSRIADLDGHSGPSLKGSRTRPSPVKSAVSGFTVNSRVPSEGDLSNTSLKDVPQRSPQVSSSIKSPVQGHSDTPPDKITSSRNVDDQGYGVEDHKEKEVMTNDVTAEGLSGKGSNLEVTAVSDGDSTGETLEGPEQLVTSVSVDGDLALETSSRDLLVTSENSHGKADLNVGLSGHEGVGVAEDLMPSASDSPERGAEAEVVSIPEEMPSDPSGIPVDRLEAGTNGAASPLEDGRSPSSLLDVSSAQLKDSPDGEVESEEDAPSVSETEEEDNYDSRTDRDSDSDSEYEEKRARIRAALRRKLQKRRAEEDRIAAEEAAKAAIREREDFLEALEREKETLEALVAEGEEQHVKKAEEMRVSMMKVAQLLEEEKQRHSVTRRQALELEVTLEAENAGLARALANAQRNLEEVSSRVSQARAVSEAKENECSNLEREAATLRFQLAREPTTQRPEDYSYGVESLEEEKARLIPKIEQYRMQAEELEANLRRMTERHQTPTPIQLELEAQLAQITDSILLKQAQLEELSTEKATLVFRVEAASNNLREAQVSLASRSSKRNARKDPWVIADWSTFDEDLEYGTGKSYSSKDKSWDNQDKFDHFSEASSSTQPLHRLVRQVDSVVVGSAFILRRSQMARVFAFLYMVALHSWFVFISFSDSTAIPDTRVSTGSIISLSMSANQTGAALP